MENNKGNYDISAEWVVSFDLKPQEVTAITYAVRLNVYLMNLAEYIKSENPTDEEIEDELKIISKEMKEWHTVDERDKFVERLTANHYEYLVSVGKQFALSIHGTSGWPFKRSIGYFTLFMREVVGFGMPLGIATKMIIELQEGGLCVNFLNIYVPQPEQRVLDTHKSITKWYEEASSPPDFKCTKGLTSAEMLQHIENKMYKEYDAWVDNDLEPVAKTISLVFHSILTTHTYDFAPTVLHYPKKTSGEFITLAKSWFNPLTGKYHVRVIHRTRELVSMFVENRVLNVYHMGVLKNHVLIAPVGYTITEKEIEEARPKGLVKSLIYMVKGHEHGLIIPMDASLDAARSASPRYNKYSSDDGRALKTMTGINIQNIKESIKIEGEK